MRISPLNKFLKGNPAFYGGSYDYEVEKNFWDKVVVDIMAYEARKKNNFTSSAFTNAAKKAVVESKSLMDAIVSMSDKDLTIAASTCEQHNVQDRLKSKTLYEVQAEQKRRSLPYAVACMNIAGDLNTGVILRSATMFCAERFFILGKRHWDRRSSVGSHNYIETVVCPSETQNGVIPRETLNELMDAYGYFPVFVEMGGVLLQDLTVSRRNIGKGWLDDRDGSWKDAGKKLCLIFGNEHYGISKKYIGDNLCISVDQGGVMRSLNVSAAASIVMHYVYQGYKKLNNTDR
jgi:tRNA G18 (ribose-2'-O)-methylase SpoU